MSKTIQFESLKRQALKLLAEAEQQPLSAIAVKVYLAGPLVFYPDVGTAFEIGMAVQWGV